MISATSPRLTTLGYNRGYQEYAPRKHLLKSSTSDKFWHKLESTIITDAIVQNELRLCKLQQAMERILKIEFLAEERIVLLLEKH